jgi:glycosyltransferase involved in cell wall biosynthesis
LEGFKLNTITIRSFYSDWAWSVLHKNGYAFRKTMGILGGFFRRFLTLFTLSAYDFIYIHREAAPIGPPIFEWLISNVFRKKIIYDFDDAIWVKIASDANPKVANLKCSWKVAKICSYSKTVSVGNDFLAKYAEKYCKDVRIIPTVVNSESYHNRLRDQKNGKLVIGWTGTFTNLYNLQLITKVIQKLQEKYDFNFLIIANRDPKLQNLNYTYQKWDIKTEIQDLLQMHIGIMPLINSEVEMGKCAFKAIQYMSLGIPPVVSPVGVNKSVVEDGITGFWANDENEWMVKLEKLIANAELRSEMGIKAREKIINAYSVKANQQKFIGLFQ